MIDHERKNQRKGGITEQSSLSKASSSSVMMVATEYYPIQMFSRVKSLGSDWQFPSDHIPVAAKIGDLRLGTFNLLNRKGVDFFKHDNEGLADSQIISDNVSIVREEDWSVREENILKITLGLVRQLDLLLLQECSLEFLAKLSLELPESIRLYTGRSDLPDSQIACLIREDRVALDLSLIHI